MPVSQGFAGGFMPGMALRAWASVTASGTLLKGSNAAVVRQSMGNYTLTLQDGNAGAGTIINIRPIAVTSQPTYWCITGKAGAAISYRTTLQAGDFVDAVHHIEVWE